ncbi:MAG: DUF202 domain-containing protein [Acidimicrobiia bacterium]|nr:DUF202 domain-containing protein [Acidimicrobiia bacterium]
MDRDHGDVPDGNHIDPRFVFANERTFLAWIRTALALITAGLAVTQFFRPLTVPGASIAIGITLIGAGAVLSFASYREWHKDERMMRRGETIPEARFPRYLAITIGLVAVAAVILVALEPLPRG